MTNKEIYNLLESIKEKERRREARMSKQEILEMLDKNSMERSGELNWDFMREYIGILNGTMNFPTEDSMTTLEALKQLYQIYKDCGGLNV